MTLTKFKICPVCGRHNSPALLECQQCENDLTAIEVVDEANIEQASNKKDELINTNKSNFRLVKICDCKKENPPQARKCCDCGEDISDIRAVEIQNNGLALNAVLCSIDGAYSFKIENPITILGRGNAMADYLKDKLYVSRKHAKLTVLVDKIYIEDIGSANQTFVNGILISKDKPVLLKNGDELGLGGKRINGEKQNQAAYFVVKVTL